MKGHAQLVDLQPSEDKVRELVKVVLTSSSRMQELIRHSVQETDQQAERRRTEQQPPLHPVLGGGIRVLLTEQQEGGDDAGRGGTRQPRLRGDRTVLRRG